MPDLPTISGGPSETGSTPTDSSGVSITANASANTKATTWTELIAATNVASNWVMVTLNLPSVAGASSGYLVDIGVGASTAEVALIPNLFLSAPTANSPGGRTFLMPLRIPADTRVSARCQCSTGSGTLRVAVSVISSGIGAPPGLTRVEAIGANTGTSLGVDLDPGGVVDTDVIAQLTATSGFAYRWMCLSIANTVDTAWSTGITAWLCDIVKGAGGAEVEVLGDLFIAGGSTDDCPRPAAFSFPCSIAAGERVAVRCRCNSTIDGDRDLNLVGYGVG